MRSQHTILQRTWTVLCLPALVFIASNLLLTYANVSTVDALSASPVATQATASFSNGVEVIGLRLAGTVTVQTGDTSDTGAVTLTAKEDGSGSVSYDLPTQGTHREDCGGAGSGRSCTWTGADGTVQDLGTSLSAAPLLWYAPNLALQTGNADTIVTDDGVTELGGQHVRVLEVRSASFTNLLRKRKIPYSPMLLALDPGSLLPMFLKYTIHPDQDPMISIDMEVTYSNYHAENGIQVPSLIQRRLNGALDTEIRIQSVTTQ